MNSSEKPTILLTGGSGRIGQFLVPLLDQTSNLFTLGRKEINLKNGTHLGIDNYTDYAELNNKLNEISEIDVFIHLGATLTSSQLNMKELYETDLKSLSAILDNISGKKLKHVIHASSYMIYGFANALPIKENHPLRPDTMYGVMKQLSERLFQLYQKEYSFSLTIFRISGVFGFGDSSVRNLIPRVIAKTNLNQEIEIDHNGQTKRDYIFVDDVVSAIDSSIRKRISGIYNLGSGNASSPNEIIDLVQKITKKKVRVKKVRNDSKRKDLVLNIEKAVFELDYLPKTSLEEGITKEIVRQSTSLQ